MKFFGVVTCLRVGRRFSFEVFFRGEGVIFCEDVAKFFSVKGCEVRNSV